MRRTTTLTAASLLGLALLAPTTTATAAGETCRGEAATIVGASGRVITGTEGRDVVVTNRSPRVSTLGGDDLICITGPDLAPGRENGVTIDAGPGDDVVDGTAADSWGAEVTLGAGADRFEGGNGEDYVIAGTLSADFLTLVDTDVDVLIGGAGPDSLTSGQDGQPNSDVVQGGGGDDDLSYLGASTAASVIDGGAGSDGLGLALASGDNAVDNVVGELRHGGVVARRWSNVEQFGLEDPATGAASVTITGGDADERFSMSGVGRVVADLGSGDDDLSVPQVLSAQSSVVGGPGRDRLAIGTDTYDIAWDLERGVLRVGHDWSLPAAGFEDAFVAAPAVELKGTDGPNDLVFTSCDGTVVGRNGRDLLLQVGDYEFETFPTCRDRTVMLGGRGHDRFSSGGGARDRMVGGRGNDVFDARGGRDVVFGGPGNDRARLGPDTDVFWGGPGRDRVDGEQGRDLCRAERKQRCER